MECKNCKSKVKEYYFCCVKVIYDICEKCENKRIIEKIKKIINEIRAFIKI